MKTLTCFLIVMFAARVVAQNPVAQNAIAIRAGGVFDPQTGSVARNQVILVEKKLDQYMALPFPLMSKKAMGHAMVVAGKKL